MDLEAYFTTATRLPQGGAPTGGGDAAPTGGGSGGAPAPALARPNVVPTNTTAPEEEKNDEVSSLQSNQDVSVGSDTSKEAIVDAEEEEEKKEDEEEPLPFTIPPPSSRRPPVEFIAVDQGEDSSPIAPSSTFTVVTCNVDNEGQGDNDGEQGGSDSSTTDGQGNDSLSAAQSEDLISTNHLD